MAAKARALYYLPFSWILTPGQLESWHRRNPDRLSTQERMPIRWLIKVYHVTDPLFHIQCLWDLVNSWWDTRQTDILRQDEVLCVCFWRWVTPSISNYISLFCYTMEMSLSNSWNKNLQALFKIVTCVAARTNGHIAKSRCGPKIISKYLMDFI